MALHWSQKRWARFFLGILLIVLGIGENRYARTAAAAYSFGVNRVDICPQNQTEWEEASRRLNCSDDSKNPLNRYHCLPVHNLSTLMEFCYNETRPLVTKGLCMVYVQEKNSMNGYNCTTFDDGCPDMLYFSDETYKFPRCMEIDPYDRCYIADSSCRSNKTSSADYRSSADVTIAMESTDVTFFSRADVTLFSRANKTLASNSNKTDNKITIIILTSVVLVLGVVCFVVVVIVKRRKVNCKGFLDVCDTKKNREDAEMPLLIPEAEIKRLGFDYLLEELPTDQKSILEIANILKIPPEILSWSTDNRQQFVRSMKKGSIPVYSGRGMVIGCAGAGKTTLVKKLKGEKNLNTKPTKGIEIHIHEFKLNAEENTIISCMGNEKNKGCLCITPSAGDHKTEVNIENNEQSEAKNEETNPTTNYKNSEQTYEKTINTEENTNSASMEKNVSSSVLDDTTFNADTLTSNTRNSFNLHNSNEINEFLQQWNFSNCVVSANEDNLKMLSLLDFAGQSAYYACHHIFFSPRAFYILVVDMSKNLNSKAGEACDKEGLIYSDWTYADYIKYWLGSIHTYSSESAPVILVASHSEDIDADPDKMVLKKYLVEICRSLPKSLAKHLDETQIFAVEKNSGKNMKDLKKCIALTMTKQNHWGEHVPVAWTILESFLKKMRESKKICLFSCLLETVSKSKDLQIKTEEELKTALKFFHDTGVILFRKEIENIIILDVQWFVDAFKCIIIDKRHCQTIPVHSLAELDLLTSRGLLSRTLLDCLWRNNDYQQYKEYICIHMEGLNMLAKVSPTNWYVPCMNKQKYTNSVLENCTVSSTLCFMFEFLPFVIFHRLVVACINNMKMTLWQHGGKDCIYHTVVILKWENMNHQVLIGIRDGRLKEIETHPYSIEIQAVVLQPRLIDINSCFLLKKNISEILENLTETSHSHGKPYLEGYRCVKKRYNDLPEGHILLKDSMFKEVDCTQCVPGHIVEVESILDFWEPIENGQSSGARGGFATDSVFYQRDPGIKNEDSRLVRNDRLTGNDDVEASIPVAEVLDEDHPHSKTSISSSFNRDILSENEGSQPIENGQSSGARGGFATDSVFYQRDPGIKNEDSRLVRNDRLTGNDDVEASIPVAEVLDEDHPHSKTSISSSFNRDILSENEGSQPIENGQSSGARGGFATDSVFYQRDPGIKNEDSRLVRNDRLTGNNDVEASIPVAEVLDEDHPHSKTSISSSFNRDILSENEGSQEIFLKETKVSSSKYEFTIGTSRFVRLARAIMGPCSDVLREVLAKEISPPVLERKVKAFISNMRKPVISKNQTQLVYGKDYSTFDVPLLYYLLRNMCSIPPHKNRWGNVPEPTDRSVSANIERVRIVRNIWYGCATEFSLSESEFEQRWNHISQIVIELEGYLGTATKYQDALLELKTCCIDPGSIWHNKNTLETTVTNLKESD